MGIAGRIIHTSFLAVGVALAEMRFYVLTPESMPVAQTVTACFRASGWTNLPLERNLVQRGGLRHRRAQEKFVRRGGWSNLRAEQNRQNDRGVRHLRAVADPLRASGRSKFRAVLRVSLRTLRAVRIPFIEA